MNRNYTPYLILQIYKRNVGSFLCETVYEREFGATPVINEYLSEQYLEEAEVSEQ